MTKYLLNEKTGVICMEGSSPNDIVVMANEIELDNGFQLVGTRLDGSEFTATLSIDDYFNGKEFRIDK